MLNSIFDRYKNLDFAGKNGRIDALDLYRFIAIVLMIQGHAIYEFAQTGLINHDQTHWYIWTFVRGLTAPVFMMISGAVNVFSNRRLPDGNVDNNKVMKRIRTAGILLLTAYILAFPASSLRHLDQYDLDFWIRFWQTSILHIVAICLILLQIFYKITRTDKQLIIVSSAFATFSMLIAWFVQQADWYSILPNYLAPYLSYQKGSIYTLFPISSYFFFGVAFGAFLKGKSKEQLFDAVFNKGVKLGLALLAVGIPSFMIINGVNYSYCPIALINPGGIVMRIGIIVTIFPLIVLLNEKVKKMSWVYLTLSKKSLFLYISHLIVIYGCALFPGLNVFFGQQMIGIPLILAAVLVEIISMSIAYYYDRSVKFIPTIRYAYLSIIVMVVLMVNILV